MATDPPRPPEAETDRAIRTLNVATMLYAICDILLVNSFMLLYFSRLGIASERILIDLALPSLIRILVMIPCARLTDSVGKVRLATISLGMGMVAMIGLAAAGSVQAEFTEPLVVASLVIFGIGGGLYTNAWFPLLALIIPESRRGRFFGTMRFLYQASAIAFTFVVTWTLEHNAATAVFQVFLLIAAALRLGGVALFYARIREPEAPVALRQSLRASVMHAISTPGFLPFSAYVFLLSLFTGACATVFSLLAKDTLALPQSQVMLVGNLTTFGSLVGFLCGGRLVDRIGTKLVFVLCHFAFAIILTLFLFRDFMPVPAVAAVGALALGFGLVQAASGVAMSSEMLAVIPPGNSSMATALHQALIGLGIALSGLGSAGLLKLGLLSPTWTLFGSTLGPYDSILLFCGVMVMLLVVTLGLVPSIMRPAR